MEEEKPLFPAIQKDIQQILDEDRAKTIASILNYKKSLEDCGYTNDSGVRVDVAIELWPLEAVCDYLDKKWKGLVK